MAELTRQLEPSSSSTSGPDTAKRDGATATSLRQSLKGVGYEAGQELLSPQTSGSAPSVVGPAYGWCTVRSTSDYAKASEHGKLQSGQISTYLGGEENGQYKVRYRGAEGFVTKKYASLLPPGTKGEDVSTGSLAPVKADESKDQSDKKTEGTSAPGDRQLVTTSLLFCRVREKADDKSADLGTLWTGDVVPYLGKEESGFRLVRFNGVEGWIGAFLSKLLPWGSPGTDRSQASKEAADGGKKEPEKTKVDPDRYVPADRADTGKVATPTGDLAWVTGGKGWKADGDRVGDLHKGECAAYQKNVGNLSLIVFGGKDLFVHKNYVKVLDKGAPEVKELKDVSASAVVAESKTDGPSKQEKKELADLLSKDVLDAGQIARARELVAKHEKGERATYYKLIASKVPYHSQRNNIGKYAKDESNADGYGDGDYMCNMTSASMALESLGIANPSQTKQFEDYLDEWREENGKGSRYTQEGQRDVAKHMGANVNRFEVAYLRGDANAIRDWFHRNILPDLEDGAASTMGILAWGGGHIVRVQWVEKDGVRVDDPYGLAKIDEVAGGAGFNYKGYNPNEKITDETDRAQGRDNLFTWAFLEKQLGTWVDLYRKA